MPEGDQWRIRSARCLIRPFQETDLDDFLAYRNDLEWMRYQSFKGLTRKQYADSLLGDCTLSDGIQLAIVRRRSGRLVGDLYLRQTGDQFWIGYTIMPEKARRGFASEAVAAAIGVLRTHGAARVLASVASENKASIGLLLKLGFRLDSAEGDEWIYSLSL